MKKFLLEIDDDGKATIREIKVGFVHIQEEGPGIIYPKYEPVNNPIPIKPKEENDWCWCSGRIRDGGKKDKLPCQCCGKPIKPKEEKPKVEEINTRHHSNPVLVQTLQEDKLNELIQALKKVGVIL